MKYDYKTKPTSLSSDPLEVFTAIEAENECCFLLETLVDKYQPHTSGQSYIGLAPVHRYAAKNNVFFEDGKSYKVKNAYSELRGKITFDTELPAGFVGGLVGYYGHEAIQYQESTLQFDYERNFNDFEFAEYNDGLVFEKNKSPEYFYYESNRLQLYTGNNHKPKQLTISYSKALKNKTAYEAMINEAHTSIQNGRVFQVVLANRYEYSFNGSLIHLYKELRRINPSPFMFYLKFGNIVTIGASPELLVHTNTKKKVFLEALAGTIRRGKNENEDEQLAKQLLADKKEIAEHSMLVDLARNDVGRISSVGSVKIEDLMLIKKLSHVQHISSVVSGTLDSEKDAFDALSSSFSAGTVSGAPKIEAIKMISQLEAAERGPYGGTIGYFGFNGNSVQALNIRSISAIDNRLFLHSGSGVVFDSTAAREAQEISEKKAAMDRAMSSFMNGGVE